MQRNIFISVGGESALRWGNYETWLSQGNRRFELIPVLPGEIQKASKAIATACGLVLTGGVDIDPKEYGEDRHPTVTEVDPARDALEREVLLQALERRIPVLGVCRGLQMTNVVLGGSLLQDINEQFHVEHRRNNARKQDAVHGADIIEDTQLRSIIGENHVTVNSSHHQSAGRLGEGLRVAATASDQPAIIEALEWEDSAGKSPLILVQWHPERLPADSPASAALREKFFDVMEGGTEK